ncbi:N-acetylmuramoyl-L-alanine amidase family protein [Niabella beijingensis]|uniref:N-acetylmuramoyl-L-alanine amidase family protein n=1 Tax=Niabella beijingensis TaxID=2872700 RepID=UPI001CBFBEF9|nr:N-acetylmuramoyl-L-alanine amidase [Niabella beijingensis]MBZ4190278.1 N-acetylmuramoyl-L-alanine amidase [Niabella beijingensis]
MKKFISPFLLFILTAGCFSVIAAQQGNSGAKSGAVKTIIVDAGHGGSDVGAEGLQTTEAAITLQVARKLATAMRNQLKGINILETRTTSALPGGLSNSVAANRYRADFANRNNGDLFISLHCNAAGRRPGGWYIKKVVGREAHTKTVTVGKGKKKKKVKKTYYVNKYEDVWVENKARGTETYIWAVGKNEQKVNSMKNIDDDDKDYYNEETGDGADAPPMPDSNDPAERVRMLIYTQNYFRKSYSLATLVEKNFIADGRTSRGVQQRNHKGIWVLQATGMPSVLVEMGFISNKEDEAYLVSSQGQEEIVNSILDAVKTYIEKYSTTAPQSLAAAGKAD